MCLVLFSCTFIIYLFLFLFCKFTIKSVNFTCGHVYKLNCKFYTSFIHGGKQKNIQKNKNKHFTCINVYFFSLANPKLTILVITTFYNIIKVNTDVT